MGVEIIHSFVTAKPQSADASLVSRNAWNDNHVISQTSGGILGATGSGTTGILSVAGALGFLGLVGTSVDNTVPRFDGVAGAMQTSLLTVADSGAISSAITGTASTVTLSFLEAGLTTGNHTQFYFGKAAAINQSGVMTYSYNSSVPAASFLAFGLFGQNTLTITGLADDFSVGNKVGIDTLNPFSRLHITSYDLNNPGLSYHAAEILSLDVAGNAELVTNWTQTTPYPFWTQARLAANTATGWRLNPLGGMINIGLATRVPDLTGSTLPSRLLISEGTSGSPVTTSDTPTVLVSRYESLAASGGNDGSRGPALMAIVSAAGTRQGVAITGEAVTGATHEHDIVGVYGSATYSSTADTDHVAYGGFFATWSTAVGNGAYGIQVNVAQGTVVDRPFSASYDLGAFDAAGFVGVDVACSGGAGGLNTCGYLLRGAGGDQFDVGFAAVTDAALTTTFYDATDAITSYKAKGSHTDGVDLRPATISGLAFASDGFSVSGSGALLATRSIGLDTNQIILEYISNPKIYMGGVETITRDGGTGNLTISTNSVDIILAPSVKTTTAKPLTITDTTASTTTGTGALIVSGGLGVVKKIYAAALDVASGDADATHGITIGGVKAFRSQSNYFGMFDAGGGHVVFEAGDVGIDPSNYYSTTNHVFRSVDGGATFGTITTLGVKLEASLLLKDGISAPSTLAGYASIYVDTADGDLKVKFGDGTVKTITVDT